MSGLLLERDDRDFQRWADATQHCVTLIQQIYRLYTSLVKETNTKQKDPKEIKKKPYGSVQCDIDKRMAHNSYEPLLEGLPGLKP